MLSNGDFLRKHGQQMPVFPHLSLCRVGRAIAKVFDQDARCEPPWVKHSWNSLGHGRLSSNRFYGLPVTDRHNRWALCRFQFATLAISAIFGSRLSLAHRLPGASESPTSSVLLSGTAEKLLVRNSKKGVDRLLSGWRPGYAPKGTGQTRSMSDSSPVHPTVQELPKVDVCQLDSPSGEWWPGMFAAAKIVVECWKTWKTRIPWSGCSARPGRPCAPDPRPVRGILRRLTETIPVSFPRLGIGRYASIG
jgi:hypothetical protein